MLLSFEVPTNNLKQLGPLFDYNFCLAPLALSSSAYLSYYKTSSKYKIVDTGIFETGKTPPLEDILKAAALLNAQEVCAPDSLKNANGTISTTEAFLNFLKASGNLGKYKVMGILQGENKPMWIKCAKWMEQNPNIDVIGISYIGCSAFSSDPSQARIQAVHTITQLVGARKPLHLLGIGGNPIELKTQINNPLVRSCDTSVPVTQALVGDIYNPLTGSTAPKAARPADFFDLTLTSSQLAATISNINTLKSWTASVALKV